jgi:hypothetical protein
VRDAFLDQGAQAAEDASAVETVTKALLEWDEAPWKAREDLAAMRTMVSKWETEVVSTRSQLQQDRATLEGAWSWQSHAEEKAKEDEQLRVKLAEVGYRAHHDGGVAPAGAERAPAGGISAPAGAIRSRGGPSCPRA